MRAWTRTSGDAVGELTDLMRRFRTNGQLLLRARPRPADTDWAIKERWTATKTLPLDWTVGPTLDEPDTEWRAVGAGGDRTRDSGRPGRAARVDPRRPGIKGEVDSRLLAEAIGGRGEQHDAAALRRRCRKGHQGRGVKFQQLILRRTVRAGLSCEARRRGGASGDEPCRTRQRKCRGHGAGGWHTGIILKERGMRWWWSHAGGGRKGPGYPPPSSISSTRHIATRNRRAFAGRIKRRAPSTERAAMSGTARVTPGGRREKS